MLRALFVLGFVSSCAPVSAIAPASPVAPTASSVSTGSTEQKAPLASMASEARTASAGERATKRSHASRLSPPFGRSAGVRRVTEPSEATPDTAPDAEREIVAATTRRD